MILVVIAHCTLSFNLSNYLSVYIPLSLSLHLSLYLSLCLSIRMAMHVCMHLSVYPSPSVPDSVIVFARSVRGVRLACSSQSPSLTKVLYLPNPQLWLFLPSVISLCTQFLCVIQSYASNYPTLSI